MTKTQILLVVCVLSVLLAACSKSFNEFQNNSYPITFQYEKDWELQEEQGYFSLYPKDQNGAVQVDVTYVQDDMVSVSEEDLDSFKEEMQQVDENVDYDVSVVQIGGKDAYKIIAVSEEYSSETYVIDLNGNDTLYLSYNGDAEVYEQYREGFQTILDSASFIAADPASSDSD